MVKEPAGLDMNNDRVALLASPHQGQKSYLPFFLLPHHHPGTQMYPSSSPIPKGTSAVPEGPLERSTPANSSNLHNLTTHKASSAAQDATLEWLPRKLTHQIFPCAASQPRGQQRVPCGHNSLRSFIWAACRSPSTDDSSKKDARSQVIIRQSLPQRD